MSEKIDEDSSPSREGIDPESIPGLFIRNVLFLDPTKPPFTWLAGEPAAKQPEVPRSASSVSSRQEQSSRQDLKKLSKVHMHMGTVDASFRIRAVNNAESKGIALCSLEGELRTVLKSEVFHEASYKGAKLFLLIMRKDGVGRQLVEFTFDDPRECQAFIRRFERTFHLTVKPLTDKDGTAVPDSGVGIKLKTQVAQDTLLLEGSGFTETKMKAVYHESSIPRERLELQRTRPLYPFLKINWYVSKEPGSNPVFDRDYSVNNTLELEIISAMAGRYVLVDVYLYASPQKSITATKGPILPSVELSKRLLKTIVTGQSSYPVNVEISMLEFIISNLPDRYSVDFSQSYSTTASSGIQCRMVLAPSGFTLSLPPDVIKPGKPESDIYPGEDLRLRFLWTECYLSLPEIMDSTTHSITQSEFDTSYTAHLEFYGSDGESWIQTTIEFAKAEQRNLVWHYSIFMAVSELVSRYQNSKEDSVFVNIESAADLGSILTLLPQFERDLRIGNVQNIQKAFKLIWNMLEYEAFKNAIEVPSMFSVTVAERREKENLERLQKDKSRRRTSVAATREDDYSDKEEPGKANLMDFEDTSAVAYQYETAETPNAGEAVREWESSSSESD